MENETWSPLFDHADLIHCENFTNYFNCQTAFIEEHGYDKYIQCLNSLGKEDYDEYKIQMMTSKVIYGYLLNIVCVTGIIGNILSFIIMRTREFRDSTTSIYLQVLMIMDSLYLIGNFTHYGLVIGAGMGQWMITPYPAYSQIYISFILIDLFRNCSVLITVAVTVERYIYVCHSLKAARWCTPRRSKIMMSILISLAVIHQIPRLFYQKVFKDVNGSCGPIYKIEPTDYVSDSVVGENIIGYIGSALFVFIPFLLLTVLTALLLWALRKSKIFRKSMREKSGEARTKSADSSKGTTVILLSVVIAFIVCSTPRTIVTIARLTGIVGDVWLLSRSGATFNYISRLLVNLNSAINVLLFCFFGKKFRRVFNQVFLKCQCRLRQRQAYRAVSVISQTQTVNLPQSSPRGTGKSSRATTPE